MNVFLPTDVTKISVEIKPTGRRHKLDIFMTLNDKRFMIAFTGPARHPVNGRITGFRLITLESVLTDHIKDPIVRAHFRALISTFEYLSTEVCENQSGLTRKEVEQRANLIAGIVMASTVFGEPLAGVL
ncbi:hypothetical protein SEA_Phreeze_42 [Mycobacterium phage Phreeze]|uniref:Uncharacterized protein n=1 Tax=Mycobacterium phage Konstantine TaxID=563121 RepID=B5U517_9CAUD|nr:gp47 [Mycobacterium phage Konstantine]ACI12463.1 hypothetical protein KONSTANTINE_47 [Mycobacterium phage Konstantine]QDH84906.1 hypothetical protein SEA_Phreeze_42 [Mycobacterium phage Phreeze]